MLLPSSPQPLISLTVSPQPCQDHPFFSTVELIQNSPTPSLSPQIDAQRPVDEGQLGDNSTSGRRQQKEITELKRLLLLDADVVKLKADLQQDLLQIRQGIDAVNTSTNSRLETVERFAVCQIN
ncbi:hypothetical protein PCANC_18522 [Puccinia coronata f. sp. avenae]|uniref:Uncharacterized protein n=1 Tax=Puccinia coronata f. sp. avenae TaxID=200324 RepID=A0A2N5RZF1_9BASI|nr:hypothetical protein PCASD_24711 [Puccinia coronata f. sp. avenae]PLW15264.1 hypothetical protein PCANC_18522 [Puccinia coronata f. sp. avenae]PLW51251.1 hypothetical protein PCASD_01034 [Puccinia coronata f. sp. avenae]